MVPDIRPDGAIVGWDMELSKAGPQVEQHAEAVADAVCELVDAVTPSTWSVGAVEDAADAIDMLAEALAAIDPEAARALAAVPAATAALRRRLTPAVGEDVAEVPAPRSGRPRRRGLGPGWKGVRATS
ncbi:hypothetical protein [Streptomyces sp. NBC_01334]|uniref:hypothetical protein n=1 Tax=Streptomyces sp. NBC_01334 TaxID=2903827 RepID=UPI002E125A01|nr:hypothetical protein OG736_46815 [Streptomyces sp. NBC_01334]